MSGMESAQPSSSCEPKDGFTWSRLRGRRRSERQQLRKETHYVLIQLVRRLRTAWFIPKCIGSSSALHDLLSISPARYRGLRRYSLWDVHRRSGSCSDSKGYQATVKITTSPKSLRNKMHQKENASLGCWWFLEENLICSLWFGLQRFVCLDFIAVEMRHLVTLASARPALGRRSPRKSHIFSVQIPPLFQNPLRGIAGRGLWATTNYLTLRSVLKSRGQKSDGKAVSH